MLHRPLTEGPVTLRRLEAGMEVLCRVMGQAAHDDALKLVPLYELLDREIGVRRSAERALAAAKARIRV